MVRFLGVLFVVVVHGCVPECKFYDTIDCCDDSDCQDSFYCGPSPYESDTYSCIPICERNGCPRGEFCAAGVGCEPTFGFGETSPARGCAEGLDWFEGWCTEDCNGQAAGSSCGNGRGICAQSSSYSTCRLRCVDDSTCPGITTACDPMTTAGGTVPVCHQVFGQFHFCVDDVECNTGSCARSSSERSECEAACLSDPCEEGMYCNPSIGCEAYRRFSEQCNPPHSPPCLPGLMCHDYFCTVSCIGQVAGDPCFADQGVCGMYMSRFNPSTSAPTLLCLRGCDELAGTCQDYWVCDAMSAAGGATVCHTERADGDPCIDDVECREGATCVPQPAGYSICVQN